MCVNTYFDTILNLTVLQQLYLIGNHSDGFGVGINFNGIESLIHRYSRYASLNYIFWTDTSFYIHCQSFTQSLFIRYKRDTFHFTVLCIQLLKYGIDNTLLVHHPTKNDILVCRTLQKIIEYITNIIYHHCFCFISYLERTCIPAPISVKTYAIWQILFELLAHSCFSNSHSATNHI